MLKSVAATFLLIIFSFNLGGSYIILKIQQHQIRREIVSQIKLGISENQLTSITITSKNKDELTWKDNEEFFYKGLMYDIVHVETISKNTKVYHCISDIQETKLIAKYNKELQKNRKDKNNRTNPVKLFKFLEKINPLPQKEEIASSQKAERTNFAYTNNYSPLSLDISSPPPKQLL